MEAIIRSITAHRGHFTRAVDELESTIAGATQNPNAHSEEAVLKHIKKLETIRDNLESKCMTALERHDCSADNKKKIDGYLEEMAIRVNDAFRKADEVLTQLHPAHQPQAAPPAAATKPKICDALKPFKLKHDSYPNDLRLWKDSYDAFFHASALDNYTVEQQHAFLFSCTNSQLAARIREHDLYRVNLETFGDVDSLMSIVDDLFSNRYPVFTRRLEYFRLQQPQGMKFTDWALRLKTRGDGADLDGGLNREQIEIFRWFTGVTDHKLRERFFLLENPTLAALKAEALRYEALTTAESALKRERTQAKQTISKENNDRSKTRKNFRAYYPASVKGKCFKCASTSHISTKCPKDPKKLYCKFCKRTGHVDSVCLSKLNNRSSRSAPSQKSKTFQPRKKYKKKARSRQCEAENGDSDSQSSENEYDSYKDEASSEECSANVITTTQVNRTYSKPTPRLSLTLKPVSKPGVRIKILAIPDTGCTQTLVNTKVLKRFNVPLQPTRTKIFSATGNEMNCSGRFQAHIGKHLIDALASSDMSDDMLLSWHDLQRLGVLSEKFPARVRQLTTDTIIEKLQKDFPEVLSDSLGPDQVMSGKPMHIHLRDDTPITPLCLYTARKVPLHFQKEADKAISELLHKNVIAKVDKPTDWVSPGQFVPKPNGKVRLVTDYTRLNHFVKRPVHPFPSSIDIIQKVSPTSKYFAKLDAVHGYFQIPLDEESSYLTTFLLPTGRYRYLRAPMGLNASGDEFCMRSDHAIEGLKGVSKLVDDILVEGNSLRQLDERLRALLERCRKHRIRLSLSKLQIGQNVHFAGHIIGKDGIKPDPTKVEALRDFASPTDLTKLRSFLGLANQLGHFIPDLAQSTTEMRKLLRKDIAFQWLEVHEKEFQRVKNVLTSPVVVKPFDPSLQTDLLTDASCLHGLGFALTQQDEQGRMRLISCGSCSITETQGRYAPVELECLAIVWAIQKCSFWLKGLQTFRIVTDHNPLLGIFSKPLADIENPRLLRMRLKVASYTFTISWQEGKKHLIADALSRAPVWTPCSDEDEVYIRGVSTNKELEKELEMFKETAITDDEYKQLIDVVKRKTKISNLPPQHPAHAYKNVITRLSLMHLTDVTYVVLDSSRLVVPKGSRETILELLHISHQGLVKTKQAARQHYYWPGMNAQITNIVETCSTCQQFQPSLPKEQELEQDNQPNEPMSHLGADLCEANGQHYLITVDRYSGFIFTKHLRRQTASAITTIMQNWFRVFGYPRYIRTDGGPCFRSEFTEFCDKHRITHELSSAYNPESNGLAESAVKNTKHLLYKCKIEHQSFEEALSEFHQTPRDTGFSPSELFFKRKVKGILPSLDNAPAAKKAKPDKLSPKLDHSPRKFQKLSIGAKVLLQNQQDKRWRSGYSVTGIREHGRSYEISSESGKIYLRNRRFLRLDKSGPN
jgi:transposase InsO family protein